MDPLAQAVERLGQVLEDSGIPRMAARVFAYILAEDRDRYTAADLAEGLDISPAAVSGAVRFLSQTGLVVRERRPTGRGDLFRIVDGDLWGTIMRARHPILDRYVASLDEAVALLDAGSRGRARLEETRDYFVFVRKEMDDLAERWQAQRPRRQRLHLDDRE